VSSNCRSAQSTVLRPRPKNGELRGQGDIDHVRKVRVARFPDLADRA
jgi:hypothetical protein